MTLGQNLVMPEFGRGGTEGHKLLKLFTFEPIDTESKLLQHIQKSASQVQWEPRKWGGGEGYPVRP